MLRRASHTPSSTCNSPLHRSLGALLDHRPRATPTMAPVTEIAYLPLKPGSNPSEADSPADSIWKDALNTVKAQPGFQRAYWSLEVENPSILRLFVDWDSIDDHETSVKSEYVFLTPSSLIPIDYEHCFFHSPGSCIMPTSANLK